jgi:WXXGXW repeat (2 copies)
MSLAWQHHEPTSHKRLATLSAALLTVLLLLIASRASADVFAVTVNVGPPALPVYEQPPIPAPGYLWTPGYWAYGPDGYFWVPGTWVEPPAPALVWTPGYWGWANGVYAWNEGYWGPQVGYYGGISYGYGYPGRGFYGGYWQNNQFYYNRSVTNITTTNITNVYTKTVVNNVTVNTVSYNGGPGGVQAQPTKEEQALAQQPHQAPTAAQTQQVSAARSNHDLLASVNHGKPPIAATPRPGAFSGAGVVSAHGAPAPEHNAPAVAHNEPPKAPPEAPAVHAPPPAVRATPAAAEHPDTHAPRVAQATEHAPPHPHAAPPPPAAHAPPEKAPPEKPREGPPEHP